jgi:hypothetical protein
MSERGKFVAHDGSALDHSDSTTVVNNLLNSLLTQCSVTLNGVSVFASKDFYNYRAYLETLIMYGHDASQTHLTSAFWSPDNEEFLAHNAPTDSMNRGYQSRWKLTGKSAEIEMYGCLNGDRLNVPLVPFQAYSSRLVYENQERLLRPEFKERLRRFLQVPGRHSACEICETFAYHPTGSHQSFREGKRPIRHDQICAQ